MSRIVSNKLAILSPYLALVGLFGVVSLAAAQLAGEAQRAAETATKTFFCGPISGGRHYHPGRRSASRSCGLCPSPREKEQGNANALTSGNQHGIESCQAAACVGRH
jgi:hypothetical protein